MTTISSTGAGSISSAGIGSGLDVNSIVTQLMAIEKVPLTKLQTKQTTIQSTVSEYGKIKSAVSTLRDLATKIGSSLTWGQTVGSSSNSAAVGVTTNASVAGSYAVEVQSLASGQAVATGVYADTSAVVGAGTLHIDVGSWSAGQTGFTPQTGSSGVDISISATDTLSDVRNKINSAGGGVMAAVMTDSSGSRLILRSTATGAANAFRTTVTDADGVNNDATGLSAFAYDPSAGASVMTRTLTASDAAATVNGLPVKSSTNNFPNVVEGMTLNLSALTSGPVQVTVASDTAAIKQMLTDFAAAYTAVQQILGTDTKYDAATKTAGMLQGDSAATGLQRQLRSLAGSQSSASSSFGRLSDIGLEIQTDGSMTVNATKLDNALANLPELKKMLSGSSTSDPTLDGFGKRFRVATSAMLATNGTIPSRTDGLTRQLTQNQKDQDSLNIRLAQIEARMRAQYTALDANMAKLNSVSTYMTNQIAAYNKNTA